MDGLAPAVPRAEADVLRALLVVLALAAGLAGGWVLWERSEDDDNDTASEAASWNTCTNPVEGFAVDYPVGWHTAHDEPETACRQFDPRPFLLGERDLPAKALQVVRGESFDEAVEGATNERSMEVLSREEVDLEAGRAVRLETRARIGSEFGGPLVTYMYIVDSEPGAFVISTLSSPGVDYEAWKSVVDRAASSLRVTESQDVVGLDVVPPPRGFPLPEPVIRKRAEIWSAAHARDYDALERLIGDEGFEYTFGGPFPGGPAAYWRSIERRERPLETLEAILLLPHAYQSESRLYVWPDAFVKKAETLSTADKAELANAVGETVVTAYQELDSYLGYRTGIDADGDWVFYVAGD